MWCPTLARSTAALPTRLGWIADHWPATDLAGAPSDDDNNFNPIDILDMIADLSRTILAPVTLTPELASRG
jgi:hypothetical protein